LKSSCVTSLQEQTNNPTLISQATVILQYYREYYQKHTRHKAAFAVPRVQVPVMCVILPTSYRHRGLYSTAGSVLVF